MFIVFDKRKIYSYLVSFSTVVILFAIAFTVTTDSSIITSATARELPIYNVDTTEKKISLTMNCAWNADDVDSILQTLKDNNVKITFFMVGDWVDKFPEAVKKISDAGHEIGNHSNTHPHVNNLSSEENIKQIQETSNKIEKIIGNKTVLYRAPYGEYNNIVIRSAKTASHVPIQWNLDSVDYTGITGDEMWKRLENKLSGGSIILMHNGTKHTADSLDMLIKNIKSKGYDIVTVSNLIYKDNYYIDNNGTQHLNNNV